MPAEKLTQSLNDLIHSTDDKIIERGREYYRGGYIENLTLSPDGRFAAEVSGSQGEIYRVFITIENDAFVDFGCDCPYDWSDVCKHIVAVCLAIQNGSYKKTRKPAQKNDLDTRSVISNIPSEKLKEFVIKYAENDIQFKNELFLNFAKPEVDLVIDELKERVRAAMSGRTHYGYIDYSDCNYICNEFDKILEQADARIDQGHPAIAFSMAMLILLKSANMASSADSSSGALTGTINYSLDIIDKCCESAEAETDKKLIFDKCVKEAKNKIFDGWDEWAYAILRSGARFVTEKNLRKIEDTLSVLREKQIGIAQKLFVHQHDLKFYPVLKSLLTEQGIWEQEYPILRQRCADHLPYHVYMEFLKQKKKPACYLSK